MKKVMQFLWVMMFLAGTAAGAAAGEAKSSAQSDDWKRGRAVYVSSCSACHHPDPSKDGPLGPAVAKSSRELLESLILRGEYPSGYKPKRQTRTMPPLPSLKSEIPYLAIYLGSDSKPQ